MCTTMGCTRRRVTVYYVLQPNASYNMFFRLLVSYLSDFYLLYRYSFRLHTPSYFCFMIPRFAVFSCFAMLSIPINIKCSCICSPYV
ncbi:hypothetical protein K435DRAFT_260878 [Dendrothele bispora CBS 962.96]|uniref:Uncharacterized protein n=1 Tax=Dendrothele bispora (strain CBS 962.96) TaxID=1314807 RepID=A0A4S8MW56_DENBC|nr:hypothetical protein K435DRAFT_260878 [Dendrothele bispora CBS 962.96]